MWQRVVFVDGEELEAFAKQARASISGLDMNYDAKWVGVAHGWPKGEMLVLADREADEVRGIALFLVSLAPLVYSLGNVALFKPQVRQYKLFQGVKSVLSNDVESIGSCFELLSSQIADGSVIFVGAVPLGSILNTQLSDRTSRLRKRFFVLPWGGDSLHCYIRWDGSLSSYLRSIGKGSARDLQRNSKALFSNPILTCELKRFQSSYDVEFFLRDGILVSDKTYQKQKLGLGLSRGGAVERLIRFAAERDAFLGYMLYINGEPAAFQYAFICGSTCTMKQTGYDPKWSKHHVGSVLFLEMLRDIEKSKLQVDFLDFMPDLNLFKLRTTNDRRRVRHYYLFKRSLMGAIQFWSMKAVDWVSRAGGRMMKRIRPGEPNELNKYLAQ